MNGSFDNIGYALRQLRRAPSFAVVAARAFEAWWAAQIHPMEAQQRE
jgi:hypothetical protein